MSKELIEQLANKPVDAEYFCKKLNLVIRDIRSYTAEELSLELARLANTAYAQTQGQSNRIYIEHGWVCVRTETGQLLASRKVEDLKPYEFLAIPAAPIESGVKG